MLIEKTIIDDAKALLLSYESRLNVNRSTIISPLSSVNVTIRNEPVTKSCSISDDTISQLQQLNIGDQVNKMESIINKELKTHKL